MEGHFEPPRGDSLFSVLDQMGDTLGAGARRVLRRGEKLIEQGTPADELFLLESGRLRVERDGVDLAEIGPGQVVGEIAFFTGDVRTADVIAARDAVVVTIDRRTYDTLCASHPTLPQVINRNLAQRLSDTSARVQSETHAPLARTVTLLPVGDAPLSEDVCAALIDALTPLKPTRHVTRDDAAAALGTTFDTDAAATWFNAQETPDGIAVYVADPNDRNWSEAALRQADQVLLIASAGTPPPLSQLEQTAFDLLPESHRRLVLIHPEKRDWVSGTDAWLDSRPVFMHHHTAGTGDGIERIARFLTGQAVGFVAGGGGALGALHTGVFAALTERGASFDIVGGTSVGSAMTGAFAMGLNGEDIDQQTREMFVKGKALAKISVPKYGLLDHKHFDHYLAKHFTEGLIEDLWIPYFAVATDLSDNSAKVIRRGPLWQAIRASAAIPGALPPFFDGTGSMLADGGTIDNLPYRVMHRLKTGPNVVVSFQRQGRQPFKVPYFDLPGRRTLLRRLVLPIGKRPPRAPGLVSVMMRSLMAAQAGVPQALAPTDWLIRPPVPKGTGFLDWKKHRTLYDIGKKTVDDLLSADDAATDARAPFL